MKKLYLLLAVIGFTLPYYFFVSFLIEKGLNLQMFFSQLFANNISSFFAVDLVITAIVFWVFLYRELKRWHMRNGWVYIVTTLAIGPSFPLPLFLYFRESQIESMASETKS